MKIEKIIRLLTGVCLSVLMAFFCFTNRDVFIYYFMKESNEKLITLVNIVTWIVIFIFSFFVMRHYMLQKTHTHAAFYRQSIIMSLSATMLFFFVGFFIYSKVFIEGRKKHIRIQ